MANPEHVEIVGQGAKAIGEWRIENPEIILDLTGADLTGADLTGADLTGADLTRADLTRAILEEANLREAKIYRTKLNKANLFGANVSGVAIHNSELKNTKFRNVFVEKDSPRPKEYSNRLKQETSKREAELYKLVHKYLKLTSNTILDAMYYLVSRWYEPNFYIVDCETLGASFGLKTIEPWNILRIRYTGTNFAFILLFTIFAFAPFFFKSMFWKGMAEIETRSYESIRSDISNLDDSQIFKTLGLSRKRQTEIEDILEDTIGLMENDSASYKWLIELQEIRGNLDKINILVDDQILENTKKLKTSDLELIAKLLNQFGNINIAKIFSLNWMSDNQSLWNMAKSVHNSLDIKILLRSEIENYLLETHSLVGLKANVEKILIKLEAAENILFGSTLGEDAKKFNIFQLLLGWQHEGIGFLLPTILIIYNLLRWQLTMNVGLYRDIEDKEGSSPRKGDFYPLWKMHSLASMLFWVAVASGLWQISTLLFLTPVVIPV